MTVRDWDRAKRALRAGQTLGPILGPLVDGDLCTASVGGIGCSRRYCQEPAVQATMDVDGTEHMFCAVHVAFYFPAVVSL